MCPDIKMIYLVSYNILNNLGVHQRTEKILRLICATLPAGTDSEQLLTVLWLGAFDHVHIAYWFKAL